jgi:hypothetical protein
MNNDPGSLYGSLCLGTFEKSVLNCFPSRNTMNSGNLSASLPDSLDPFLRPGLSLRHHITWTPPLTNTNDHRRNFFSAAASAWGSAPCVHSTFLFFLKYWRLNSLPLKPHSQFFLLLVLFYCCFFSDRVLYFSQGCPQTAILLPPLLNSISFVLVVFWWSWSLNSGPHAC